MDIYFVTAKFSTLSSGMKDEGMSKQSIEVKSPKAQPNPAVFLAAASAPVSAPVYSDKPIRPEELAISLFNVLCRKAVAQNVNFAELLL